MKWYHWLEPNWPRLSRWCLIGAVVMLLWQSAPMVKCSWKAWNHEPLDQRTPHSDNVARPQSDSDPGFFTRWSNAISGCYKLSPPLEQEAWKRHLMFGLLAGAVLLHIGARINARSKRSS